MITHHACRARTIGDRLVNRDATTRAGEPRVVLPDLALATVLTVLLAGATRRER